MTLITRPLLATLAAALACSALTACAGSSGGSEVADATSSSPNQSPAPSAPLPSADIVADAPSRLVEYMTQAGADKVTPRLRKLPGVFRVHYSASAGKLFIYLDANITKKQRERVLTVAAPGTAI